MNIDNLLEEVKELRLKGIKTVNLEKLEAALLALKTAGETAGGDAWKSKVAEMQHASKLAEFTSQQETSRAMIEAAISFAGAALKAALLINGGAAVAILAYLGNSHAEKSSMNFPAALAQFTAGVLFAAMATAGSYFSQWYYAKDFYSAENQQIGDRWRMIAIALVTGSYICFGAGSHSAYSGFVHLQATLPSILPAILSHPAPIAP